MPNILSIPNSSTIFFSSDTAGASTSPALTGNAVSLAHNGSAGLTISSLNTSSLSRLQVNGTNGQLFNITDAVTGTVFTVNDASGLPIVSVDTGLNDIITLGTYGSNALVVRNNKVGVGTTTPTEALTVSGNISASGTITIDSTSAVTNPKLLITASTAAGGAGDNVPLVIKGSGANRSASINLRTTGGSGELYDAWVTGKVGGGIHVNNSFTVTNGNSGPQTGTVMFSVTTTSVGIGVTTPNAAAILDVTSTTKGFLPPRMTETQRDAISSPPDGLEIYNTTTNKPNVRSNGAWIEVAAGLAANVATFLATPTSTNLAAAVTDETGTGALVFANSPTLITPNIGAATGDSLTVTGNISASGTANTLPNQTLSRDDNTRILTQKTSARDDMWSAWQKRWIQYFIASNIGTSFSSSGGNLTYSVTAGTSLNGRSGSFSEGGLTVNPGQGASWYIPSSFAIAFGFYGLYNNNVVTSNNVTSGSNTFTVNSAALITTGHRITSSAFPDETYVSSISGTTVTATKNAISTPSTPHTLVFSPDQISRVVLGTRNEVTRYSLECPNAQEVFATSAAKNIGDTVLQIASNITSATAVIWNGQPYFILTTANSSITNSNGTTFYAACSNFPSGASAMNVLRCDNASSTPVSTTGTWDGTITPTNQITVASGTNIQVGGTVSGLGIPQNTSVNSIVGTTVTLNQTITTSGTGVTLYFGYQRIYVDQNATATATGQNCAFLAKNTLNQYVYGRGISSGTTITNIANTGPGFLFTISNALTQSYINGVYIAVNFTSTNSSNNCIFMDYSADPADGYLKVRLGYMLNGLITYSPWTSFPKGNVPSASYNYYCQAVIDYNAATDKLRLFADRSGDIVVSGMPRDFPKPPSTPTITMTGVSGLEGKITNLYFGAHIYGNNVNTLVNNVVAKLDLRQLVYYPYQTFVD